MRPGKYLRALALPDVARTSDLNASIPAKCGGRLSAFFYLHLAFEFVVLDIVALRIRVGQQEGQFSVGRGSKRE